MARALYDVYDREGNKIIGEMTSTEIGKALNVSTSYVAKCENEEKYLRNKYKIVKVKKQSSDNNTVKNLLLNKWDETREPFLKAIWVKEDGPGIKKLTIQGG